MFDTLEPFQPAAFFQFYCDVYKAKKLPKKKRYDKPYLLPQTVDFLGEESFADMALCYDENGLNVSIFIHKPFEDVVYPQVTLGDCVELFFDTRDLKSGRVIHKFCHHFVFFPKPYGESCALEITKFREDDAHKICDNHLLQVDSQFHKNCYEMDVFIDAQALYGFDPSRFDRLGFTYRINRRSGSSQHFNISSIDYALEKHPHLWATLNLMNE